MAIFRAYDRTIKDRYRTAQKYGWCGRRCGYRCNDTGSRVYGRIYTDRNEAGQEYYICNKGYRDCDRIGHNRIPIYEQSDRTGESRNDTAEEHGRRCSTGGNNRTDYRTGV